MIHWLCLEIFSGDGVFQQTWKRSSCLHEQGARAMAFTGRSVQWLNSNHCTDLFLSVQVCGQ
ncbi:MAG: hypothetical protein H6Q05_3822 [Acidobacteria bacterium]|nr:hypothetical protein [Acidobacteriota bacterium]